MRPHQCSACDGTDLRHGPLKIGYLKWPVAISSHFSGIYLQAAVCLTCGTVATYVDEPTLTWLRGKGGGILKK